MHFMPSVLHNIVGIEQPYGETARVEQIQCKVLLRHDNASVIASQRARKDVRRIPPKADFIEIRMIFFVEHFQHYHHY
jgi:hypothetical protein